MTRKYSPENIIDTAQEIVLLKYARQTILHELGHPVDEQTLTILDSSLKDPVFSRHLATFVTIRKQKQLRGCIGNLVATESVLDGIKNNAIQAAFHDSRFSPLTEDEIDFIDIEISVLTAPQPVYYIDGSDLIAKLRPNIDGVTIKKGLRQATFLPQVWEQLQNPEAFLTHLCRKASLPDTAWQVGDLDIEIYQVQHFSEKTNET